VTVSLPGCHVRAFVRTILGARLRDPLIQRQHGEATSFLFLAIIVISLFCSSNVTASVTAPGGGSRHVCGVGDGPRDGTTVKDYRGEFSPAHQALSSKGCEYSFLSCDNSF
jgi:hypothetical protein